MGRAVNIPAVMPISAAAWRVAALTMMDEKTLAEALSGEDADLWVEAAAACGIAEAQVRLGRMLLEGEGVARDAEAAFACFQAAAESGDPHAYNMLGRAYENGWGVDADAAAARDWYRQSAEGGYFRGAYNFAHILAGEGDITGAAHWFAFALEKGWEPSLGTMMSALSSRPEPELQALARNHASR